MKSREIDPDLLQAIEDLRHRFYDLRRNRQAARSLKGPGDERKLDAVQAHVADLVSIIHTRADRIGVPRGALTVILGTDADIKMRVKRRPSRKQMEKELGENRRFASVRLTEARGAFDRAKAELETAERQDAAVRAAILAYTGMEG